MNWVTLIVAFAVAVAVGAFLARLLERSRPGWTRQRRLWTAAAVLPGFLIAATLVGEAWVMATGADTGGMRDLALFAVALVGAVLAAIAFAGGLVGASFASARDRE